MSASLALGLGVLFLAGNAFFVGAEFAVISARRSSIEPRAAAGDRRQRVPRALSLEPTKFLRRNDDDGVASVNSHMLGPFAADAPHQFAEARLGVLKEPPTR